MVSVLFVCLGNICRSPTAHGVLEKKIQSLGLQDKIRVDSAGTGAWHINEPADARSQAEALDKGYDLSHLRARQVVNQDFQEFDYILAMDFDNLYDLQSRCVYPAQLEKVALFLSYSEDESEEVPDPYSSDKVGFSHALALIESAADGLLASLIQKHNL